MKNRIKVIVYFIFLTILSGILTPVLSIDQNIQISGQLTENRYNKTSEIEKLFRTNLNIIDAVIYKKVPRGLVVSIDSSVFFEEGRDEIMENSKQILDQMGEIIKFLDKPCIIEGNSNTTEIAGTYYQANWEISIVRAEKIVQYLIKKRQVDPQKIRAVGFGEIMPFDRNVSYKNDRNRRIDFVIINYEESNFNILPFE